MKKIQNIITILCLVLLLPCCENDGGDSKISTQNGALPNIQKLVNTDSFIDLLEVQSGGNFNLGFSAEVATGKVSSMDIVGFYIKSDGTISKAVLASKIISFPVTYTLNRDDLYTAFSNVNTPEDFESGDKFIISADITLTDGTVLKIINDDGTNNFSSNIATSNLYKVFQTYNVTCASYLGGTYQFTTTNVNAPTGEFAAGPLTGTVTFKDLGGGVYDISDASFGGYNAIYDGDIAKGVQLQDICNKISFSGKDQYNDVYSFTSMTVNGENLTFHWKNDYGEYGDTTLTRTDNTNWPSDLTF